MDLCGLGVLCGEIGGITGKFLGNTCRDGLFVGDSSIRSLFDRMCRMNRLFSLSHCAQAKAQAGNQKPPTCSTDFVMSEAMKMKAPTAIKI